MRLSNIYQINGFSHSSQRTSRVEESVFSSMAPLFVILKIHIGAYTLNLTHICLVLFSSFSHSFSPYLSLCVCVFSFNVLDEIQYDTYSFYVYFFAWFRTAFVESVFVKASFPTCIKAEKYHPVEMAYYTKSKFNFSVCILQNEYLFASRAFDLISKFI